MGVGVWRAAELLPCGCPGLAAGPADARSAMRFWRLRERAEPRLLSGTGWLLIMLLRLAVGGEGGKRAVVEWTLRRCEF